MKVIMDERDLRRLEARMDAIRTDLWYIGVGVGVLLLIIAFLRG